MDKVKSDAKRRKKRRFKIFNLVLLGLAAYFVFTIVKQEFKLKEIQKETAEANQYYAELKQQEGVLNKKIADASSTHMVENKAKSILGWVNADEIKVIEKKD